MSYNLQPLDEFSEAMLRFIQDKQPSIETIRDEFQEFSNSEINSTIDKLRRKKYIRDSERIVGVVSLLDDGPDPETEEYYELAPLGKSYLAKTTTNYTSFSNITGSNISNASHNISQSNYIKNEMIDEETQELLTELKDAIVQQDKSRIVKTLEYIGDKSVDVLIGVLTGKLQL